MKVSDFPWSELDREGRAFFSYDLDILATRTLEIRRSLGRFSKKTRLSFSVKSNPHPEILKFLDKVLDGFDVSSDLELQLCQRLGISAAKVSLSGPGKTNLCLQRARQMEIEVLHLDSLEELEVALGLGFENLSFRIHTPDIFSTKLGLTSADLSEGLLKLNTKALGLHSYLGREAFSWERLDLAAKTMQEWLSQKAKYFVQEPQLYLGPGIPGGWLPNSPPEGSASAQPRDLTVTFEVGRGLVAGCGYYAVPVLSRKALEKGGEALIVHGGLQHLGSPFVTLAQKVQNLQVRVVRDGVWLNSGFEHDQDPAQENSAQSDEFLVAGSLCLGHDILHPRLRLPKTVRRGDWLVFPQAGAYGLSAGVPFFIGQDLPREFIVRDGVVTDQTMKDFRLYHECFKLEVGV
jgi:diaminopimelate decarboxylase